MIIIRDMRLIFLRRLLLGDFCRSCMARIPYATLIATLMCLLGVGIFCGTMYRGASLTVIMMDQVFHLRLIWIEAVQMIFVIIAAGMAALATGATRYKVYRAWRSRVGGRISCAVVCNQLNFIFPANIKQEDLKICEKYEIKAFCKDGVENAEVMFILATLAVLLVILSLVHYLMCLSANYAHIRDHEKFQELQEIQNLNELEFTAASKDRF
uniref:Uncharacterized protein n=1 Tax=Glossina brevipalpis TaxID=37001 RepID=A0A1A9WBP3_9MUSC